MHCVKIRHLGLVSYDEALRVMDECHQQRCAGMDPDTILILEHLPVITKGRRLHSQDVSLHPELQKKNIVIKNADRGGLLTYHGPGQIVIYFVLRLSDYFSGVVSLVQTVEQVLCDFLKEYGVKTQTLPDYPGVWVGAPSTRCARSGLTSEACFDEVKKKIASVGFRVKRGVTCHGVAFNVNSDLDVYRYFEPCGIEGSRMTNLEQVLGRKILAEEYHKIEMELGQRFMYVA